MPRRRDRVADTDQLVRDLRNQIFKHDQEKVLPLRQRIAELEQANESLTKRLATHDKMLGLYRAVTESVVGLLHALASGKAP